MKRRGGTYAIAIIGLVVAPSATKDWAVVLLTQTPLIWLVESQLVHDNKPLKQAPKQGVHTSRSQVDRIGIESAGRVLRDGEAGEEGGQQEREGQHCCCCLRCEASSLNVVRMEEVCCDLTLGRM